jgi:hypothetical protein
MPEPIDAKPPREPVVSPKELSSNISVAEDLARFRTEVEHKIIDERLPWYEWRGFAAEALDKYPSIETYGPIIRSAMVTAQAAKNEMDDFCRRRGVSEQQDVIEPQIASTIISDLFKFTPTDDIKMDKGVLSFSIVLSNKDFTELAKKRGMDGVPAAFHTTIDGVKINVYDGSGVVDLAELESHELEHAKNRILTEHLDFFATDFKEAQRLKSSPYKRGWDEILAFASSLEALITDPKLQINELDGYRSFMIKAIDRYRSRFAKDTESKGTPAEKYIHVANAGIDAWFDLCRMYTETELENSPIRMTTNLLAQFPLESWPAVVRLINQQHSPQPKT